MTGGPDGGCENVAVGVVVVVGDDVAVGDGTAVAARFAVADGDGLGFGEAAQAASRHAVPAQAVTNPIETFICVITRRNSMRGAGVTGGSGNTAAGDPGHTGRRRSALERQAASCSDARSMAG